MAQFELTIFHIFDRLNSKAQTRQKLHTFFCCSFPSLACFSPFGWSLPVNPLDWKEKVLWRCCSPSITKLKFFLSFFFALLYFFFHQTAAPPGTRKCARTEIALTTVANFTRGHLFYTLFTPKQCKMMGPSHRAGPSPKGEPNGRAKCPLLGFSSRESRQATRAQLRKLTECQS